MKTLIEQVIEAIANDAKHNPDEPEAASWGYEQGILLSRKDAQELIDLTQSDRWIPVTKEVPPTGIELLCISEFGNIAIGSIRLYNHPNVRYVCYKSSKIVLNNVTHFQQLPPNPNL